MMSTTAASSSFFLLLECRLVAVLGLWAKVGFSPTTILQQPGRFSPATPISQPPQFLRPIEADFAINFCLRT